VAKGGRRRCRRRGPAPDAGNALIIGKPGTGKSHVAKALAYQGTLQGYNVRYVEADSSP
jgi:KaiC/GvpD/RAD55 family RecA-like ATPase